MNKIDTNRIIPPQLECSPAALKQLNLMLEHDFTLRGKYLRIEVAGKGCDGFTYQIGFSFKRPDDFLIPINKGHSRSQILMDPFSAFYLPCGMIDFVLDPGSGEDGFVVINFEQNKFAGKFWQEDSSAVPPLIQANSTQ